MLPSAVNIAGCILHSVQGIIMLIASQAVPDIKAFQKQITTNYLWLDVNAGGPGAEGLVSRTQNSFKVESERSVCRRSRAPCTSCCSRAPPAPRVAP